MAQYVSSITRKGQVTIPGDFRKALKLQPKDLVAFELIDGEVRLRPFKSAVLASYGTVKPLSSPEEPINYRRLRRDIEEEIADEVASEG